MIRLRWTAVALVAATLALGVLAAPPLAPPAAADETSDLAAARALFERNLQAIRDRDAAAYLACYREDPRLVFNGFDGPSAGYEDFAAGVGEGWPDVFEGFDLEVFPVTDGVVFGSYRYRVHYGETVREGISERVFLRTPDGWRIAVSTAFDAPAGALPAVPGDDR